jgi:hypothetical protein
MSRSARRGAVLILTAVALLGCARPLRFRPEWPADLGIGADYRVTDTELRVEIESAGYRVEEAVIVGRRRGACESSSSGTIRW